ncbi:MAG: hypothetical protein COT84_04725 [Chlamydiae bacterium CG10_big_fil_rev_8_21_14_0_10_35_9]|nr:MAG: hypothetical protein COT84_04725 [Chlamydiae bacterium CG10_big_fil_rev_8_21_14_0_10_35_9]
MKLICYFFFLLLGFHSINAISQEKTQNGIYNAPAQIKVNNAWKFFTQGSFIYWQAREEGLEIALENPTNSTPLPSVSSNLLTTCFKYKPGFKVALGYRYKFDQIVGKIEYTRLYQTTRFSAPASTGGSLLPIWLNSSNTAQASSVNSTWKLDLDILDGSFSSKYIVGRWLNFQPFFGVRAAWIDQRLKANYFITSFFVESSSKSNSWAIGPNMGISSDWLLGLGFYGIGNASASLLYTRYRVNHYEKSIANPDETRISASEKKDTLRSNVELNLGLGWGSYLINKKFHIDFKVSYDFLVFFYQNMMRNLLDTYNNQLTNSSNNLYLHGLTVKAQFDF